MKRLIIAISVMCKSQGFICGVAEMTITPKEETEIYPAATRLQVNLLAFHIVKSINGKCKTSIYRFS